MEERDGALIEERQGGGTWTTVMEESDRGESYVTAGVVRVAPQDHSSRPQSHTLPDGGDKVILKQKFRPLIKCCSLLV